jgi:hypothetical protein
MVWDGQDIEVSDAHTFVRGITTSALTFTGQRFFFAVACEEAASASAYEAS